MTGTQFLSERCHSSEEILEDFYFLQFHVSSAHTLFSTFSSLFENRLLSESISRSRMSILMVLVSSFKFGTQLDRNASVPSPRRTFVAHREYSLSMMSPIAVRLNPFGTGSPKSSNTLMSMSIRFLSVTSATCWMIKSSVRKKL
jgi:hypothetical protein